jgi:hypothetical protein
MPPPIQTKKQSLTWMPSLVVVLIMLEFIPILIASWACEMTADGLRLSLPVCENRSLHLDGKHATFG